MPGKRDQPEHQEMPRREATRACVAGVSGAYREKPVVGGIPKDPAVGGDESERRLDLSPPPGE